MLITRFLTVLTLFVDVQKRISRKHITHMVVIIATQHWLLGT